jgi:EAL domain-containing protein (putative c-di-GMP-specific phosphodiesterase class I)
VRRRDTLARLGGDEFGLLMEYCTLEQAQRIANAILAAMQEFRFRWEGRVFSIGVSMGLVPISADSGDATAAMRAGDAACYVAKDQGRNRVHISREGDLVLLQREAEMSWMTRIGEALEQDRFQLYCQPIVPASGGHGAGAHYELLLRLTETNGTVVSPGAFLPAAERCGLSSRIDRWVLQNALEWHASHPLLLQSLGLCSINLSGQSLGDDGMLAFLVRALDGCAFPGDKLCLEITETAAVSDFASAGRFIRELRRRDVRFALDDFGSGLSSFGYLKSLPVDYLKIDGVFVKDIIHDPVDRAMVQSIIDIGHVMGKQTIAEFVENDEIRKLLAAMGVDFVQGYGVGRPRPLAGLAARVSVG